MNNLIDAKEFAAGAAQLAALWQRCLPGDAPWRWVPARQPFACSQAGGYLATERCLVPADMRTEQQFGDSAAVEAVEASPEEAGAGAGAATPGAGVCNAGAVAVASEASEASGSGSEYELEADEEGSDDASARQLWRDEEGKPWRVAAGAAAARLALTCHVVYHPSYRVPVLFFEACGPDGVPLGLEALLAALPRLRAAMCSMQPGTVVSHEEHPFLRRPFFTLHPCQTGAVMQLLLGPGSGQQAEDGVSAVAMMAAPAAEADTPAGSNVAAAAVSDEAAGAAGTAQAAAGRGDPLRFMLAWLSVVGQPLGIGVPAALWANALRKHPCS